MRALRGGRVDGLLAGATFIALSLMAGRVFRFPFDDEIFSLNLLEACGGFVALGRDLLQAIDVHPPISYLAFYPLWRLGVGPDGLRWLSLSFSAAAVVIAQRIVMQLLPPERIQSAGERAIVVFFLASTPLLVSQGDAIRWYPLFTMLFMACIHEYLRQDARGGYGYAILAGLLASTNFLGFFVFPMLEFDRLLRKGWKIEWKGVLRRAVLAAVFALPGLITLWHGLGHGPGTYVGGQLGGGRFSTLVIAGIGFFGGDSLGLVQSIATLPTAVLTLFILYLSLRDLRSRALALNVAVVFLLLAAGFGKPRSFVYFALCASILMAYQWLVATSAGMKFAIAMIGLLTPLGVIANLQGNATPYKRNTAVPFDEVLRFARSNAHAGDVVVLSDVVLHWEMKRDSGACISLYLTNKNCDFAGSQRLIVIDGYAVPSVERTAWLERKPQLLATRREVASVFFGADREAHLKRRVIPEMDDYLMKGVIYEATFAR